MKPQISSHSAENFRNWADGMRAIAQDTSAFCKLSGIVTEANGWTLEDLRLYASHVLEVFGPNRVMWDSNWPVCQLKASYDDWRIAAEALASELSQDEQAQFFGGTAARFYKLWRAWLGARSIRAALIRQCISDFQAIRFG